MVPVPIEISGQNLFPWGSERWTRIVELTGMANDNASGLAASMTAQRLHLFLEIRVESKGLGLNITLVELVQLVDDRVVVLAALDQESLETVLLESGDELWLYGFVDQLLKNHSGAPSDEGNTVVYRHDISQIDSSVDGFGRVLRGHLNRDSTLAIEIRVDYAIDHGTKGN